MRLISPDGKGVLGVDFQFYKAVDGAVDIPDAACPSNIWGFGYTLAPEVQAAVEVQAAIEESTTATLGDENGPV